MSSAPEPYVPRPQFVFDEVDDEPKGLNQASILVIVLEFIVSIIAGVIISAIMSLPLFFVALFFTFAGMNAWLLYIVLPVGLAFLAMLIFKQIPSYRTYREELDHPGHVDILSILYGAFFMAPLFSLVIATGYMHVMLSGIDVMPM